MAKASMATIDPREASHFGALAADWWDPRGRSAMLHKLNPVRLRFVREAIDAHWDIGASDLKPLAGKAALDVGCGAGLLCEPLARLGADVTGLDAAPENVEAANAHAAGQGLSIRYACADIAHFSGQFDLVTAMEVIEHVADPALFMEALAARLKPGGLLILSTPNRTAWSRLGMVMLAERLGAIPHGTHDWDRFLLPEETVALAEKAGLSLLDRRGIAFSVAKGLVLSDDERLNYIMSFTTA